MAHRITHPDSNTVSKLALSYGSISIRSFREFTVALRRIAPTAKSLTKCLLISTKPVFAAPSP